MSETIEKNEKQTLGFEAETKQVLDLVIHSLYSNKEIFLRELVSNASDAADKLRFSALSNEELYEGDGELKVRLSVDKEARTLTISDNGIGMTVEEVKKNIGTIAHSGTKKFFESLTGDEGKDSQMIGQFGVGFYSGFIVADKVTVVTRKAGEDKSMGVQWESSGEGEYTIETVEKAARGTDVILHLKEGEDEFLESYRLQAIIHKFSEHLDIPIVMKNENKDEEKEDEPDDITVNSAKALWTKAKNDLTEEDYHEFYKQTLHDYQDPLAYTHSKVEGKNEYTLLLYVPAKAPFDMWDREATSGVKLYVKRTFIMEGGELMPRYLRFVKGIIDSDSLPLNVSRELLQQSKQIDLLKAGAVKKILSLIEGLSKNHPEKFDTFWAEFGAVLKEGPIEDVKNKDRIAKLLRFASTKTEGKQTVTLASYIENMQEGQDKIYYLTGSAYSTVKNSPHLEVFKKKGIEVLLLTDHVDEWLVQHMPEFDGKSLQSVAKGDLDLDSSDKDEADKKTDDKKEDESLNSVLEQIKSTLDGKVKDVRVSSRLTDSPACLVADEHEMGAHMERIMKAAGQDMPTSLPIFEINADHALIQRLKDEADDERFADLSNLLFEQALLSEGGQLEDPATFVHRLNKLLQSLL
ncbi:MAG: molecular chaperone HtpG [Cycloclasticus pugetii]|jgi:molecular chaperone HtpG|uniref:Chaperone protein HtpG n=1 Tax=Cycloclasticus pugetii TaxID=34068 RepID=A0AB33Z4G5_9GAMM|nr:MULTISPECIES: molecular chaperone HtpG [Cycloclasticus]AFT66713.1 Heat shock protein Hsp90-like protein [Cycloclasticus sp. P1]ATI03652.1 molecular chaperone HtpG [Cycloclasticus sp. PY97N]EPD14143.1 heat shock protein 90 [Cycloclasticus pugetii]MBV1898493.1 molecular chaperone HtpG [Cycloclasticus sp.]MDF1829051.1 molecular chaperone HtpG [Cycloclasticus pugetii]